MILVNMRVSFVTKRGIILLILAAVLQFSAYAADGFTDYTFTLMNEKGTVIAESIVHFEIKDLNDGSILSYDRYLPDGILELNVAEGNYELAINYRSTESAFFGHYGKTMLQPSSSPVQETIILTPIAHIRGTVVDAFDNYVAGAGIKYECAQNYAGNDILTDVYGSFSLLNVPLGNCKIFASEGENIANVEINADESMVYDVEVHFESKTKGLGATFWWGLIIGIIIVVGILVILRLYSSKSVLPGKEYSKKPNETPPDRSAEAGQSAQMAAPAVQGILLTDRMAAVLSTLDAYEQEVVEYLLKNNGTSTQNQIRYSSGIPKTSLFRCLQRLEQKKIIKTESIGKMKKTELTEFFLTGNENKVL